MLPHELIRDGCDPNVPPLTHCTPRQPQQTGLIPSGVPGGHCSTKESICFQLFSFQLLILLIAVVVVIVELALFAESQNINN